MSPTPMRIGSTSAAPGAIRCSSARTGATTICGPNSGSCRRDRVRTRCPIVSMPGLTRSNGNVSHAGKRSTTPAPRYTLRSAARRSAPGVVGVTTRIGLRFPVCAIEASTGAWAPSGTASCAARVPRTLTSAGSSTSAVRSCSNCSLTCFRCIASSPRPHPATESSPPHQLIAPPHHRAGGDQSCPVASTRSRRCLDAKVDQRQGAPG